MPLRWAFLIWLWLVWLYEINIQTVLYTVCSLFWFRHFERIENQHRPALVSTRGSSTQPQWLIDYAVPSEYPDLLWSVLIMSVIWSQKNWNLNPMPTKAAVQSSLPWSSNLSRIEYIHMHWWLQSKSIIFFESTIYYTGCAGRPW